MSEPAPETTAERGASADPRPAPPEAGRTGADSAGHALLVHLESIQELQTALSQEERDDEILRVGTTAAVEILGVDCGIALVHGADGGAPMRFGWAEGCELAQHEIGILSRNLDEHLARIRRGEVPCIVLAADPPGGFEDAADEPPAVLQSRGLGSVLILGLGQGARRCGALILARREPTPFPRESRLLAEILALQFAVQIERVRQTSEARNAFERTKQEVESATRSLRERNQELESLNAVAASVTPSFEFERQLDLILRRAADVTRHQGGAIHLVEGEDARAQVLRCARGIGDPGCADALRGRTHRRGEGIVGRVWESGTLVALADLRAEVDAAARDEMTRAGYHGLLCAPLRARGRTLGVIELFTSEERFYLEEDRHLAQAVADQVGLMIQNARLLSDLMHYSLHLESRAERRERALERRGVEAEALRAILDDAGRRLDPGAFLEAAIGRVLHLLRAEAGLIHLVDRGTGALRIAARSGSEAGLAALESVASDHPVLRRALETGSPLEVEAPEETMEGEEGGPGGPAPRFRVAVPLRSGDAVIGALSAAAGGPCGLAEEELKGLASIGTAIGIALDAGRRVGGMPPLPHRDARREVPQAMVRAQKMESIGMLAGGIAHDFNNIVGAILGYATHIKSRVARDNPIHRHASIIEEQSLRATELIQQLLALSGGAQTRREPTDLNRVLADTVALLSRGLEKSISLEVHTEPELPAVEVDPEQMKQVLLSLAVNARDAMPEGGRISFETRLVHLDERYVGAVPDLRSGDYVEMIVADSGVGMPPQVAERAFEPFFTTKPEGLGTGLGLAVVEGIVRGYGGHVDINSAQGVGTTVRIYLPAAGRADPRPHGGTAPSPRVIEIARDGAGPAPPTGRVLVVDDEESIRQLMRDVLEGRGVEVLAARDGVEALDVYRREWGRIEFVVLDMLMPRLSGLETFRRLRGMDRRVRVLLSSGDSNNEQARTAMKEGALGLLAKPFTMSELLAWVDRLRRGGAAGGPS
ncbi:MAG: GAF domain-containing protein [Acidobacteriota bacterium]